MVEEKIDWNRILYYKEISNYLSFNGNIELSMCSLKLRDKLYNEKFKPFELGEYLKKEDFRTFEVEVEGKQDMYDNPYHPPREIIQANVDQFEIELQTLNPTVETFIIYQQYDFLYGYKVTDRFVNITTLNLNHCKITKEMFQYMLDNLKLSELSIKSTLIMYSENNSNNIIMPQPLKKIGIFDVNYAHIDHRVNPFSFKKYSGYNSILSLMKFKSLKTLYCKARIYNDFAEFIELNPQLKSLTLRQYVLSSKDILPLIKNNQIEYLDSELSIDPISENGPHILESLKSLVTIVGSNLNTFINIAKSCPNLSRLTTYISSIQSINNSIGYASQLKGLKYYALKSYKNQVFKDVINLPVMNELKALELTNFNPDNLDWNQLSLFPKLKMVKFLGYHIRNNCKSFVPEIQNSKTWKLLPFEGSMTYQKL